MSETRRRFDADAAIEAQAAACGRRGLGRAEVADRMGWSRGELEEGEEGWSELEDASARTRDAALAWWEARARAWAGGARSNASLWSKAMAGRFGAEGYATARAAPRRETAAKPKREITDAHRAKGLCLLFAEIYGGEAGERIISALEAEIAAGRGGVLGELVKMRRR